MTAHPEAVVSPRGNPGILYVRDGTSDLSIGLSTFSNDWARGDDEYRLRDLTVDGVFVDVGAHVGSVALAVLLDNPNATAILVEPVVENMAIAREAIHANGFEATFVTAAVGGTKVTIGADDVDDRYVANLAGHGGPTFRVERVTLPQLVRMAGGRIAALKVDCEGGEWELLRSKAVAKVDRIFGEWHGHTQTELGPQRLHRLLDATHEITDVTDAGGVGLFWAVRR